MQVGFIVFKMEQIGKEIQNKFTPVKYQLREDYSAYTGGLSECTGQYNQEVLKTQFRHLVHHLGSNSQPPERHSGFETTSAPAIST